MTIRQYEYFLAVVDDGSFTRAATRLHVSQPSLSQQIQTLEASLGARLFERSTRRPSLTPAGRALLPQARAAVNSYQRGHRAVIDVLAGTGGELHLATVSSIAVGVLPPALSTWHDHHHGVRIVLREHQNKVELQQAHAAGQGDLAIGPHPGKNWRGEVVELGWETFLAVRRPDESLDPNQQLTLEELEHQPWVLFPEGHGLHEFVIEACATVGYRPAVTIQTGQVEAACRLAAAGLGVTMVPANAISYANGVVGYPTDPLVVRQLYVYGRGELSELAREFATTLRRSTEQLDSKPPVDNYIEPFALSTAMEGS